MTQKHENKLVRLYLPDTYLAADKYCTLPEGQAHYLRNVMRMKAGDSLRVFNEDGGEWIARIKEVSKKNVIIFFVQLLNERKERQKFIHVLASPVKKEAFELMIEKAAELDCFSFYPVICDRTIIHRMNHERLHAIAVEAAEQCERMDIMKIEEMTDLKSALESWNPAHKLLFCQERAVATCPIAEAVQGISGTVGILIGPEGGFSENEIEFIRSHSFVEAVSLGDNILRAETAMIAALACVQTLGK